MGGSAAQFGGSLGRWIHERPGNMSAPIKRFVLFDYDSYYPAGGWGDFEGSFDTLDEARAAAKEGKRDHQDIIDLQTGESVSLVRPDAVVVSYGNALSGWHRAKVQYPDDVDAIAPHRIFVSGITTREQALRHAKFEWERLCNIS